MHTYSISQLAKAFGLSRSTLLYYDRIGLLAASVRTAAGYRQYSQEDHNRLERICTLRRTGLSLSDIQRFLSADPTPAAHILEHRLKALEQQILSLRNQQHVIVAMLKEMTRGSHGAVVDKQLWVKMLAAAGMDEPAMMRWHAEFERHAPDAHFEFLLSLGIPEDEACQIRQRSREIL